MATDIKDKNELASLIVDLKTKSSSLLGDIQTLQSSLSSVNNYDGIDVSSNARTLKNNYQNAFDDIDTVLKNMENYANLMIGMDIDDFGTSGNSNTVSYEDIFKTDGSSYQNAKVIWDFLKYKGLSDAAAAGVLGNIQAESGFKPGIEEIANGIGYGLIQWSFGRRDALEAAARQRGVDPSNLQFQLEYLWEESLDPNTSYGKKLSSAGFYTTDSPADAAYYFHKYVEISADSRSAIQNNRCAPAEKWYNEFKGTSAGNVSGSQESKSDWGTVAVTSSIATATLSTGATVSNYSNSNNSSAVTYSYSAPSYSSGSSSYPGQLNSQNASTGILGDPDIDISVYKENLALGFDVTTGNLTYELEDSEFELICAIVSAESDKSYDDALAVITTILNRCETDNWIRSHGTDPVAQATAPNQFVVYQHGSYKSYMNGNAPETVVRAVKDALAGVRNHKYLSFRSNGTTSYSSNMISPTGNRYK